MTRQHPIPADTDPACRDRGELFFPGDETSPGKNEAAKRICDEQCPPVVRDACLAFALHHLVDGIWGGRTAKERNAMRRQHGIVPDSLPTWLPRPYGGVV